MQNFFSTAFVDTETNTDNSRSMVVVGNWWILLAAAVPLTVMTLAIWLMWVNLRLAHFVRALHWLKTRVQKPVRTSMRRATDEKEPRNMC